MLLLLLLFSSLWVLLCTPYDCVQGHGYLLFPESRNVYHGVGPQFPSSSNMGGSGDVQNLNAGIGGGPEGMAAEKSRGHEVCGDISTLNRFTDPNSPFSATPIQATLTAGSTFTAQVVITAYHYGWFEFRLCTRSNLTQACLNERVLELDTEFTQNQFGPSDMPRGLLNPLDYAGAQTNDYSHHHTLCDKIPGAPSGSCCFNGGNCSPPAQNKHRWMLPKPELPKTYSIKLKVPVGISCDKCVLQWMYQTANSVDQYPEAFWNCADIRILPSGATATPTAIAAETKAPTTLAPTRATLAPTTIAQSFAPSHSPILSAGQCTGLPCSNPEFCRSEFGFCGIGPAWCGVRSTWTSACPLPNGQPVNENKCRGEPCLRQDECRSSSNYCGTGIAYCNALSTFTPSCLEPNVPTKQPTTLAPTLANETKRPTTIILPPSANTGLGNGCSGAPCENPIHCRSKFGFCNTGDSWCNSESIWKASGCGGSTNNNNGSGQTTSAPTKDGCEITTLTKTFSDISNEAVRFTLKIPTQYSNLTRFQFKAAGDSWKVEITASARSKFGTSSQYDPETGTISISASESQQPDLSNSATLLPHQQIRDLFLLSISMTVISQKISASFSSMILSTYILLSLLTTPSTTSQQICSSEIVVTVTVPINSVWGTNPAGILESREDNDKGETLITFLAPGQAPSVSSAPTIQRTKLPTLPPSTKAPTIPPATSRPTAPTNVASNQFGKTRFLEILESKIDALNAKVLLAQQPNLAFERSKVYHAEDLVKAIKVMVNNGVDGKFFFVPSTGTADQAAKVALVGLAAFLAQSRKESINYDACDENNWDLINGKYPLSNACGQLGQNYQDYSGPHACPVDANMEITATTNAKWYGAPGPYFCAPKSKTGQTGYWDYTYNCNNPWKSPPELCDAYQGQQAGRYDNSIVVANRLGRTDVEGCCWWGRGVIQTTGPGNYGDLNFFMGKGAADRGAFASFPDVDFCKTPDAVCSSTKYPELKWVAGLLYWINSVQGYNSGGFEYTSQLSSYVANGIQNPGVDSGFIASISGIVNRGCHNPPCASGAVDGGSDRAKYFQETLQALNVIS